ncbi:MAG: septal ring lytic transglycosylase RlpA family protein [Desulfobulbaceae bacterium]|nr:septal ring lytic transglycosylase RlpA family protein [Desulfobulbaceae bacterium]
MFSVFDDVLKKKKSFFFGIFILSFCLLFAGCGGHHQGSLKSTGKIQRGKASYYAMKFQFRKTASGERFNNYAYTAAHKTLPFGTNVRVINRKNGKYVDVRINDRGPFVKGRVIDLSRVAFAKIASIKSGVVDVEVRVLR